MFSLESPHRGDSNEYTQYTIFNIKKKKKKAIAIDSRLSPAKVRWRQPAVSLELSLVTAS